LALALVAPAQDPWLWIAGSGAGLGLGFSPKDGPDAVIQGQCQLKKIRSPPVVTEMDQEWRRCAGHASEHSVDGSAQQEEFTTERCLA